MTQEQKDLLLKDLCARLPYGVVVATTDNDGTIPNFWMLDLYNRLTEDVRLTNCEVNADRLTYFCDVRPYLFPLSSMTEEQKEEYDKISELDIEYTITQIKNDSLIWTSGLNRYNWFIKNHFDVYDLIPKGLAIDATGKYIY